MFKEGQILDNKYKIEKSIGAGGGGIVYKAHHNNLDKDVAIKLVKDEVSDILDNFGEANILKDLKNDYVPQVYDFIISEGQIYTVMEFIDGESLQELIDRKKAFSRKDIIRYARQLCTAAAYLHSRKPPIIHSDIKPANIMLTKEHNICLIDYNISLIVDGKESAIGVSDGYSPPEQYKQKYAAENDLATLSSETMIDTAADTAPENEETLYDSNGTYYPTLYERTTGIVSGSAATLMDNSGASETFADRKQNITKTLVRGKTAKNPSDSATLINTSENEPTQYDSPPERKYSANTATLIDEVNVSKTSIDIECSTSQKMSYKINDCTEALTDKQKKDVKQVVSNSGRVDERSDIYSIGATLYCLATGSKPNISTGYVEPLSGHNTKISESFAAIIDKAMQKDPAKRFRSAEKMLKALNNLRRYDKRYMSMLLRQEIAIITVIFAMALSGLTAAYGYSRLDTENLEQYISYVEEMDNTDSGVSDEYYEKAIELVPEHAEAYERMAYLLYNSEDYAVAAEYINNIINGENLYVGESSEPYNYESLYYLLGMCCLETEEYPQAVSALEKATALNSENAEYFCNYAVALARNGDNRKAEDVLEIAVNKGLNDENVLFARGEIEYSLKNYAESIENLKKCIETTEDDTIKYRAYVICANAYADSYDSKSVSCGECTAFYDSAIEALPIEKTLPFYEMSARVNIAEGQITDDTSYYAAAINDYEKMNSLGWETIEADYSLIRLYRYVGNYDYAKEFALELLEKNGDDFTIYKLLAFVESDIQGGLDRSQRDYSAFSEYYKKAKKLCADSEDFEMQRLDEAYAKLIEEGYIKG